MNAYTSESIIVIIYLIIADMIINPMIYHVDAVKFGFRTCNSTIDNHADSVQDFTIYYQWGQKLYSCNISSPTSYDTLYQCDTDQWQPSRCGVADYWLQINSPDLDHIDDLGVSGIQVNGQEISTPCSRIGDNGDLGPNPTPTWDARYRLYELGSSAPQSIPNPVSSEVVSDTDPSCIEIINSTKYIFVNSLKNHIDAESYCFDTFGTNLASIHSISDLNEINTLCNGTYSISSSTCYIGLHDKNNEGDWVWSDGSAYNDYISNWHDGEPNDLNGEDCVEIIPYRHNNWNDINCDTKHAFICNRYPFPLSGPYPKNPTLSPTNVLISEPSIDPTIVPTFTPSMDSTSDPSCDPTRDPTMQSSISITMPLSITPATTMESTAILISDSTEKIRNMKISHQMEIVWRIEMVIVIIVMCCCVISIIVGLITCCYLHININKKESSSNVNRNGQMNDNDLSIQVSTSTKMNMSLSTMSALHSQHIEGLRNEPSVLRQCKSFDSSAMYINHVIVDDGDSGTICDKAPANAPQLNNKCTSGDSDAIYKRANKVDGNLKSDDMETVDLQWPIL